MRRSEVMKAWGFSADPFDTLANRPDRIAKLVSPLANSVRFLESKGVGIKLFIPDEARRELSGIRSDRIRTRRIQWDDARLGMFLRARVHAYSNGAHEDLTHVFEDYARFEPHLLRAAAATPRNVLRILDAVVSEHCLRDDAPSRIESRTARAGLRAFEEHRLLEDDVTLYRERIDAWDRAHAAESDEPS